MIQDVDVLSFLSRTSASWIYIFLDSADGGVDDSPVAHQPPDYLPVARRHNDDDVGDPLADRALQL